MTFNNKIKTIAASAYFWPLLLTLLTFLLRLAFLNQVIRLPFINELSLDPGFFDRWGLRISKGQLLSERAFFAAPLYPYLLGLIYATVGHSLLIVRVLQALLGSLSLLLIFYLTSHFFNKRAALIACLLYFGCGIFFFYESLILKTCVGVFLNLLFICFLVRFEVDRRGKDLVLAGVFLGLATAIRGNVLFLVPFLCLYLYRKYSNESWVRYCLVLSLSFFMIIMPITLHNYVVSKDFVLINSNGGVNFYIGNNSRADGTFKTPAGVRANMEYEETDYLKITTRELGYRPSPSTLSRHWFAKGLSFLKHNPEKILRLYGRKILLYWNHLELSDNQDFYFYRSLSSVLRFLPPGFGIIAPLGLCSMLVFYQRKNLLLPYLFVIVYFFSMMPFFVFARYRVGTIPFLIIFAAGLTDYLWTVLVNRDFKKLTAPLLTLVLTSALVYWPLPGMKSAHTLALSYNKYGYSFYQAKQYDKAIEAYRKSLEYFAGYPEVYNRLGILYLAKNDYPKAKANFQKAVELDKNFLEALSNYAQLMERIDPGQAVTLWQSYLAKAIKNPKEKKYLPFAQQRLKKLQGKR